MGGLNFLSLLRDRVLRSRLLPAFQISECNLDLFVAEIQSFRPRMLFGYPSELSHIARHVQHKGMHLDRLGIRWPSSRRSG